LTTALCASGLPTDRFFFEGFLPAKAQERKAKLQSLRGEAATLVFYEAPHRLLDSLAEILEIFGDREISVARELTKVHEEFRRGKLSEVVRALADRDIKGEIVIMVHGASGEAQVSDEELHGTIRQLAGNGMGVKEIAELLGERYGLAKKEVYKLALDLKATKHAK
jgi:16S rRNA (cytidine1402-2'-O)-methyltransferase